MLRLLIVDDEPMFREGLISTVDWQALGVTVAGEAYNGLDALKFLETTPVDLVITDIRMPEMDGLELIRRSAEKYPGLRYIVLSAFDDFQLVKKAFQLGIVDYILKSEINESELTEILKRQEIYSGSGYAELNERLLLRQMLRTSVERKVSLADLVFPQEALPFSSTSMVYCCLLNPHLRDYSRNATEADLQIREILKETEKYLDGRPDWFGYSEAGQYLLFHFPGAEISWRDFSILAESLRGEVESHLGNFAADVKISAGFSAVPGAVNLNRPRKEASSACSLYLVRGAGHTYGYPRYRESLKEESPDTEKLFRQFAEYIKLRDIRGLSDNLASLSPGSGRLNGGIHDELLSLYEKYYYHLLSFCEQMGFDNEKQLMEELAKYRTLTVSSAAVQDFTDWLSSVSDLIAMRMEGRNSLVSRVIRFVQDNYSREISLTDVADVFKVNPSYLSRVFSRQVGKGFNAYLTEIRISRAQHLLEDGNLLVYEVAGMVGIGNPETFSRIFRRVTGKAPRDYLS